MTESRPPLAPELFAEESGTLWVMHCATGPIPRASVEAARRQLELEARPWADAHPEDSEESLPQRVRREAARLLGGRREDVTLTPTTTTGLVTVARGLDLREGDEVVLPQGEFPANVWPWRVLTERGIRIRTVELWEGQRSGAGAWATEPPAAGVDPETRLLAAVGERTRLVAVSWVRFQDGLRLDLPRLAEGCREKGVPLVVDGIQGVGTLPVSLQGISALAAGGHKGLLAPQGLGILWTEEGFRKRLLPPGGWLSVEEAMDFDRPCTDLDRGWLADGSRLEAGVPNLLGCAALEASLATINHAGVGRIAAQVARLQHRLLTSLAGCSVWREEARRLTALLEAGRLGSILALHHGGRGPAGLSALLDAGRGLGILASVREGYLRVALHGWHTEADADRLGGWLGQA